MWRLATPILMRLESHSVDSRSLRDLLNILVVLPVLPVERTKGAAVTALEATIVTAIARGRRARYYDLSLKPRVVAQRHCVSCWNP
jgi:hypothetical protein